MTLNDRYVRFKDMIFWDVTYVPYHENRRQSLFYHKTMALFYQHFDTFRILTAFKWNTILFTAACVIADVDDIIMLPLWSTFTIDFQFAFLCKHIWGNATVSPFPLVLILFGGTAFLRVPPRLHHWPSVTKANTCNAERYLRVQTYLSDCVRTN